MPSTTHKQHCSNCGELNTFKVEKKKRAPNSYNHFVSDAMRRPEVEKLSHNLRMDACSLLWKDARDTFCEKVMKSASIKALPREKREKAALVLWADYNKAKYADRVKDEEGEAPKKKNKKKKEHARAPKKKKQKPAFVEVASESDSE